MKSVKFKPIYGSRVVVVPAPAKSSVWREAAKEELAVLLVLLSSGGTMTLKKLADAAGTTISQAEAALAHWSACGMITVTTAETGSEAETASEDELSDPLTQKYLGSSDKLPLYNTDETARYLERNKDARRVIDSCQQALGKIFNTSESNVVIGLLDYLSLRPDYVCLLCNWCASNGKKSLRYIEKLALGLHDDGITSYDQLEIRLRELDAAKSAEGQLRSLLGIGSRALTEKEQKAFRTWTGEWSMPVDVIRYAFEITADRTGKASVPYMNSILSDWHASGVKTLEEAQNAVDARGNARAAKTAPGAPAGSFDTDDFFESALRRSYGTDTT